jgi:hypothetical protein
LAVPRLLALLLAAALAAAAGACQHPTGEQCEQLCWRYNELHYWERFEREAAGLAPDARERLRAERQKEWAAMRALPFDPGLENCMRGCRRSAPADAVDCVRRATTSAQAEACLE